jgi:hypothetical protein
MADLRDTKTTSHWSSLQKLSLGQGVPTFKKHLKKFTLNKIFGGGLSSSGHLAQDMVSARNEFGGRGE